MLICGRVRVTRPFFLHWPLATPRRVRNWETGRLLLGIAAIVLLIAPTHPQASSDLYRCRIVDAFNIEEGLPTRDSNSAHLAELMNPTIVGTQSCLVRSGTAPGTGSAYPWRIEQRGGQNNDFIVSCGTSNRIHIRPWREPIQFVRIANNFFISTGTCEAVR